MGNVLDLTSNSIANLLFQDREYLSESRLLLMKLLGFNRSELISKSDTILTEEQLAIYKSWMIKIKQGFPVNMLLGLKEFYSREFRVTKHTLIPRPETELLVEYIVNMVNRDKLSINSILDLGTGSGCIAITLSLELNKSVVAVDNSPKALSVAKQNANLLGANVEFVLSDWFENVNDKFDMIVSNPPYIALNDAHLVNLIHEPLDALTDYRDGYSCISHIINHAVDYLNKDGYLLIEHGFEQKDIVQKMYKDRGYVDIVTMQDYAGLDRFTVAKYKGK